MELSRRKALKTSGTILSIVTVAGCTSASSEEESNDDSQSEPTTESEEKTDADEKPETEPEPESSNEEDDEEEDEAGAESAKRSLELLAEANVDHDHACFHAEYDERTPLEAGDSVDDAPTVSNTHIIWEVTYEDDIGYVRFDADKHAYGGAFVFYTAGGSASPVDGTEVVQDTVPDEDCSELDEYLQVEPEDGQIVLELTAAE
ncbi:hypothetical protein [Natronobeatus ordinarius]|uniref:hypothetical protein n=1 Tax=Natronobeatus ordinarius TaxID=2963433 RepID=UPI0020CD38CC|nr:hypothetical protein [Natronobeatus ordinarius]